MKKIIAIICLVFSLATILTGCSLHREISFKEFYKNYEYTDTIPALKSYTKISDLSEMSHRSSSNGIFAFNNKDGKKLKFYNINSGSFVLNLDTEYVEHYQIISANDEQFIIVVEQDENKSSVYYTNLYDASGNLVATKNGYTDSYQLYDLVKSSIDLIQFNGCIYRVNEGGSTTALVTNPFFGALPSMDTKTEDYYYVIDTYQVTVYSHDLEEVFHWSAPQDCYETPTINVTSEDCLLVQYLDKLPDSEKKYDIIDGNGNKYNLTSKIVDVSEKKEKEVNLDYAIIEYFYAKGNSAFDSEDMDMIPSKVKNLAFVIEIKDKRVVSTADEMKCVAINGKNGKIEFVVTDEFDNLPCPIVKDRFEYYSNSGYMTLIDADGEYIGRIDSLSSDHYNETYIVKDKKIYDFNLQVKYDLSSDDKEYTALLGHSVLLEDDDNVFVYTASGELKTLDGDLVDYRSNLVVTRDDGEYVFYDENGNSLGSIEGASCSILYTNIEDGICVVSVYKDGTSNYYKFTK